MDRTGGIKQLLEVKQKRWQLERNWCLPLLLSFMLVPMPHQETRQHLCAKWMYSSCANAEPGDFAAPVRKSVVQLKQEGEELYLCLATLSTFWGLAACAGTMKLLFSTGRLRNEPLPRTEGSGAECLLLPCRLSGCA